MRVNSINNINYTNYSKSVPSFKHTAVPYPEYPNAYKPCDRSIESTIITTIEKLTDLFNPKVSKEAQEIKSSIDSIYANSAKQAAKQRLMSVLA